VNELEGGTGSESTGPRAIETGPRTSDRAETDRIADELGRAHAGDPWHGSPVRTLLDGVSAAQAASHPIPNAHSIWELVLHMTSWRREVSRRLRTGMADDPEAGDWPPVTDVSDDAWRRALAALDDSHEELLRAVRDFPAARLDEPVGDRRDRALGTGVSYSVTLHGIAQHDAYHAGQISLLRKAARG
jgi:uncharacterized damage-inducible protein DinB